MASFGTVHQEQIRDIPAGNEQHDADRGEKNPEDLADVAMTSSASGLHIRLQLQSRKHWRQERDQPRATTAQRGDRDVSAVDSTQPCCMRDEGRPLGLGLQGQGPNHRSCVGPMAGVVSVRKRRDRTRQVCAGKTNASEPLMTCRKRRDVTETRLQSLAWDKARRSLLTGPSGGPA